jgi:hypothetical protein
MLVRSPPSGAVASFVRLLLPRNQSSRDLRDLLLTTARIMLENWRELTKTWLRGFYILQIMEGKGVVVPLKQGIRELLLL